MLAVQQQRKEDVLVGVCCVGFDEDVGCVDIDSLLITIEEVVVSREILGCSLEMISVQT